MGEPKPGRIREVPLGERTITPEDLLRDNRSSEAVRRVGANLEAKLAGKRLLVEGCGDARVTPSAVFDTAAAAVISSIATGGSRKPVRYAYNNVGTNRVIIATHEPCGGQAVKAARHKNGGPPSNETEEYVDREVVTPHPVIQAIRMAIRSAHYTKRPIPILAAVVENTTLLARPFALIQLDGANFSYKGSLSPDYVYERKSLSPTDEVPPLDRNDLPGMFQEDFMRNVQMVLQMQQDPKFAKSQEVQNPPVVVLSTSIIPAFDRYPGLLGRPNSYFSTMLAKVVSDNGSINIRGDNLREAMAQILYPITHAITAKPEGSFFDTKTLLIETPDMALSRKVAADIVRTYKPIRDWQVEKGGQILIAGVDLGNTHDIDRLK